VETTAQYGSSSVAIYAGIYVTMLFSTCAD